MSKRKKMDELWVCWVDGDEDAFVGTEHATRTTAADWAEGGAHPVFIGTITAKAKCRVTFVDLTDDE